MATKTSTYIESPRRRNLAKWIWLIAFIGTVGYFLVSSFALMQMRLELCQAEPCNPLQVTSLEYAAYGELGIPVAVRVLYLPILDLLAWLVCAGLGLYIFIQRSDDWVALLTSLLLVMAIGTQVSTVFALPALSPQFIPLTLIFSWAATLVIYLFLAFFPDGKIVPRWLWLAMLPFMLLDFYQQTTIYAELNRFVVFRPVLFMVVIGTGGQIYRYLRAASPIQRQQTKWILFGIILTFIFRVIYIAMGLLVMNPVTGEVEPYSYFLSAGFGTLAPLAMPISIAFSVLKFRLWDIDLTINRSLVYGTVTLLLTAIFGGIVAIAALVTQGQGTSIGVAVAALGAGVLFNPIRKQIQHYVDRNLYGLRFDLNELKKAEQQIPEIKNSGALTGRSLGDYQVLGLLGAGGMGEVYQGFGNGQTVAIKTMLPRIAEEPAMRSRFEREAQAGIALEHPHIAKVYAHGEEDGTPYLVMDFIEGQDLSRMLKADGKLDEETMSGMMRDICDALDSAHDKGFVHRDLKPANIMVKANGEAILMDFGIIKMADATSNLTGTGAIGTIDYMAPEQIMSAHEVDKRADIYALGVMVYELMTGQRPFSGSPAQVMFAHIQQPAPDPYDINAEIPRPIANAIMRAMEKDPNDRYQSAGEFAAAFQ